jgi:hypothetical protein
VEARRGLGTEDVEDAKTFRLVRVKIHALGQTEGCSIGRRKTVRIQGAGFTD